MRRRVRGHDPAAARRLRRAGCEARADEAKGEEAGRRTRRAGAPGARRGMEAEWWQRVYDAEKRRFRRLREANGTNPRKKI